MIRKDKDRCLEICTNSSCPSKKDCYHAQVVKSDTYIEFEFNPDTGRCKDYIKYW